MVTPALDCNQTGVSCKSFFHFRVQGYPSREITIRVQPVELLSKLQKV